MRVPLGYILRRCLWAWEIRFEREVGTSFRREGSDMFIRMWEGCGEPESSVIIFVSGGPFEEGKGGDKELTFGEPGFIWLH